MEAASQQNSSGPSVLGKRPPRGRLTLSKCSECRRDKKKCEPQPREWPERCQRCIQAGLACSPNTTSRESKKRRTEEPANLRLDLQSPQQPSENEQLSDNVDTESNARGVLAKWSLSDISNMAEYFKMLNSAAQRYDDWITSYETLFDDNLERLDEYYTADFPGTPRKVKADMMMFLKNLHAQLSQTSGTERPALGRIMLDLASCVLRNHSSPSSIVTLHTQEIHATILVTVRYLELIHEFGAALALLVRLAACSMDAPFETDQISGIQILKVLEVSFRDCVEAFVGALSLQITLPKLPQGCFLFPRRGEIQRLHPGLIDFWEYQDMLGTTVLHWIIDRPEADINKVKDDLETLIRDAARPTHPSDNFKRTLIHTAAERNLVGIAKSLLDAGLDPNVQTITGSTALHYAASMGHVQVCHALLGSRADVDVRVNDHFGNTPLYYAAKNGRVEVLKLLLEAGANIVNFSGNGDTPLHVAIKAGESECVRLLLEAPDAEDGFDEMDNEGDVPLFSALKGGEIGIISMLLLKASQMDISNVTSGVEQLTALKWAIQYASIEVIEQLLDAPGIEVDAELHFSLALERDDVEIVKLLLQTAPSNINAGVDPEEGTILHWAARNGHNEIVKILLQIPGVDVNALDDGGNTALMTAIWEEKPCYKEFLGHPGTKFGKRNYSGKTVLHRAAAWRGEGLVTVITDLLPFCSRFINSPDQHGKTALHVLAYHAPRQEHTKAVRTLLEVENIRVGAKDSFGRTPLHDAADFGNKEVCRLLMVWMDRVSSFLDNDGRAPSSLALEEGHHELFLFLKGFEDRVLAVSTEDKTLGFTDKDSNEAEEAFPAPLI